MNNFVLKLGHWYLSVTSVLQWTRNICSVAMRRCMLINLINWCKCGIMWEKIVMGQCRKHHTLQTSMKVCGSMISVLPFIRVTNIVHDSNRTEARSIGFFVPSLFIDYVEMPLYSPEEERSEAQLWECLAGKVDANQFHSLISLLIKSSLLRCENVFRPVINCWESHDYYMYFFKGKNCFPQKGYSSTTHNCLKISSIVGWWLFKCFHYYKTIKGLSSCWL